jgi:serine/threonine protein kinase
MTDVLGTRLGRYEIRERLGRGGTATVYKAWDTTLERWVAVKVLHDFLAEDSDFNRRFEYEARLVAGLSHPNLVQIFDFDVIEHNGQPVYYMVMAYISGQSLKAIMDEKHKRGERLSPDEIANVMQCIADGLAYAHSRDMVHRDVTPGNILFNDQGQAVLADFGIARIVSSVRLTKTGMTSGTPLYMSPEQGTGQGGDNRSDIYSLGVILYEMISGQAPFNGDTAVAIMMQHVNAPVPPLKGINGRLGLSTSAVVYRALAKAPEDRYPEIGVMLRDFKRAAAGERLPMPPKGTLRLRTLPQRMPWGWLAAWLALIATLLTGAIALRGHNDQALAEAMQSTGTSLALSITEQVRTFVPAMTQSSYPFRDDFSRDRKNLGWPITTNDPNIYRNIVNGEYTIRHTLPNVALTTIFDPDYQYGSLFEYEAELRISPRSQPDTATGIIFRYHNDDEYYVYGINGLGQVSIWVRSDGRWTELRNQGNWTPTDSARSAGRTNRLRLVDKGSRLQGYVNGALAFDLVSQPRWRTGAIGIYLASTSFESVLHPYAEVQVDTFSAAYYATGRGWATPTPFSLSDPTEEAPMQGIDLPVINPLP